MDIGIALSVIKESLMNVLVISGILIVPAFIIGLIISIFQATTQIQEQSLTFIPKFIATIGIMILAGSFIISRLGASILKLLTLINKF